jgi:hypothetical protein
MWKEVEDEGTKGTVLGLLKGSNKDPRPGDQIDTETKRKVMEHLYDKAYKKRDWVSAGELIKEGSLAHEINVTELVSRGRQVRGKKKIAVGFHGTARNPDTVLKVHGGTKPTIERHGKSAEDKAGIQKYLKEKLGIEEWHPFWFGGDIEKRPFLFRNIQADNELDTTISVAKAAQDSIDFPMIESMPESEKSEVDAHGFPITTTYVYAVGVTEGYGTTEREQKPLGKAFGQGEIATKRLDPDDHLGYVKYERIHAGPSRNLGYRFRETFSGVLPGGRKLRATDQVKGILGAMPKAGMYHVHDAEVFDANKIYSGLKESGKRAAESASRLASKTNPPAYLKSAVVEAKKKVGGTDEDWRNIAIAKEETIKHAPSEKAKAKRLEAYLEGVREVLPTSGI